MYQVYKKQEKFETYVLADATGQTYIEVVPERGCIISSYVYQGEPVFYLEQATLEDLTKNIRGGNPILFPISSYLVDETYQYNGSTYQMKQHGFARNLSGKVVEASADEHNATITLEMSDDENTYKAYPFHFRLLMTYTLSEAGLKVEANVHNEDEKVMPFYLGYHPYFYVADKEQLQLTIPSNSYRDMVPNSIVAQSFNFNQDESNAIYDQLSSHECVMVDQARQLQVSIVSDEVFQYVVLWALDGKSFVCIEPWMAPVNGMNVGQGIQQLEAGRSHISNVHIKPQLLR